MCRARSNGAGWRSACRCATPSSGKQLLPAAANAHSAPAAQIDELEQGLQDTKDHLEHTIKTEMGYTRDAIRDVHEQVRGWVFACVRACLGGVRALDMLICLSKLTAPTVSHMRDDRTTAYS